MATDERFRAGGDNLVRPLHSDLYPLCFMGA